MRPTAYESDQAQLILENMRLENMHRRQQIIIERRQAENGKESTIRFSKADMDFIEGVK